MRAQYGDTVKIHYIGMLQSGNKFYSTYNEAPFTFTIGKNNFISGFNEALIGMDIGERKKVTLPPEKAFGDYDQKQTCEVKKKDIREDISLIPGKELSIKNDNLGTLSLTVKEIRKDAVVFDANHPLAGKTIVFDIELVDIVH